MSRREVISYSDVAPEEIPATALPDPNFVEELRETKKTKSRRKNKKSKHSDKVDIMTQYYDEIDDNLEEEYEEDELNDAALIDGSLDVWDDSALLDAWDAANEEYKLLHGNKSWKADPNYELETPSMIWYDSNTDLGKIATKQTIAKNKQNKRKRELSDDEHDLEDEGDDKSSKRKPTVDPTHTPSSYYENTQNINTGDPGKDYVLHQLSQAWYAAGYWTGILHEKYGDAN